MRKWREANHVSQDEGAHRAGITQAYWNALESGKRTPSIEVLCVISNVIGISKSALLDENINPPLPPVTEPEVSGAERKTA